MSSSERFYPHNKAGELFFHTIEEWQTPYDTIRYAPTNGIFMPRDITVAKIDLPEVKVDTKAEPSYNVQIVQKTVMQLYVCHKPLTGAPYPEHEGDGTRQKPFLTLSRAVEVATCFIYNTCTIMVQIVIMEGSSVIDESVYVPNTIGMRLIIGSTDSKTYFSVATGLTFNVYLLSQAKAPEESISCVDNNLVHGDNDVFPTVVCKKSKSSKDMVTFDYFLNRTFILDDSSSFTITGSGHTPNNISIRYDVNTTTTYALAGHICIIHWYGYSSVEYGGQFQTLIRTMSKEGNDIRVIWSNNATTLFKKDGNVWTAKNVHAPNLVEYTSCTLQHYGDLDGGMGEVMSLSGTYKKSKTEIKSYNGIWKLCKLQNGDYVSDGGAVIAYIPKTVDNAVTYTEKRIAIMDLFNKVIPSMYTEDRRAYCTLWRTINVFPYVSVRDWCSFQYMLNCELTVKSKVTVRTGAALLYSCVFKGGIEIFGTLAYNCTFMSIAGNSADMLYRLYCGVTTLDACVCNNIGLEHDDLHAVEDNLYVKYMRNTRLHSDYASYFATYNHIQDIVNSVLYFGDSTVPSTLRGNYFTLRNMIESSITINLGNCSAPFSDVYFVVINGAVSKSNVNVHGNLEYDGVYSNDKFVATYLTDNSIPVVDLDSQCDISVTLNNPDDIDPIYGKCSYVVCCDISTQDGCVAGCSEYTHGNCRDYVSNC